MIIDTTYGVKTINKPKQPDKIIALKILASFPSGGQADFSGYLYTVCFCRKRILGIFKVKRNLVRSIKNKQSVETLHKL